MNPEKPERLTGRFRREYQTFHEEEGLLDESRKSNAAPDCNA
jgi:hypothetical protein